MGVVLVTFSFLGSRFSFMKLEGRDAGASSSRDRFSSTWGEGEGERVRGWAGEGCEGEEEVEPLTSVMPLLSASSSSWNLWSSWSSFLR